MKQPPNFVSIESKIDDRRSTLQLYEESMQVLGNLPHAYHFAPTTVHDAEKLIIWLTQWIVTHQED